MGATDGGIEAVRANLTRLAEALLQYYEVARPPVPVERMLREPPTGMDGVDPDQISSIVEHGLYSYDPRLAMARLLYREMVRAGVTKSAFDIDLPSVSYDEMKFFARCLLMPAQWMRWLAGRGLSVEQMSHYLQAPPYAVVARLAELGLVVPDTG